MMQGDEMETFDHIVRISPKGQITLPKGVRELLHTDLVRLVADGDGWRLTPPSGRGVRQSTPELVASLRRPSFWRRLESP